MLNKITRRYITTYAEQINNINVNYKDSFELKIKTHVNDLAATEAMIFQESILQNTSMFCNCCLLEMADKNILNYNNNCCLLEMQDKNI